MKRCVIIVQYIQPPNNAYILLKISNFLGITFTMSCQHFPTVCIIFFFFFFFTNEFIFCLSAYITVRVKFLKKSRKLLYLVNFYLFYFICINCSSFILKSNVENRFKNLSTL